MPHFQATLTHLIASRDWASARQETMQAGRIAGLRRATDTYYAPHGSPSHQGV